VRRAASVLLALAVVAADSLLVGAAAVAPVLLARATPALA
jgi:hypothetical protein